MIAKSELDEGKPLERKEFLHVLVVHGLFVLVNLLTAARSPTVWLDEIRFKDPAANLVEGHGLTSTAWEFQSAQELWAGNAPLHTWLLVLWIKMFGLTPTAVRAVNFVYIAIAALLLWVGVRRLGLIEWFNSCHLETNPLIPTPLWSLGIFRPERAGTIPPSRSPARKATPASMRIELAERDCRITKRLHGLGLVPAGEFAPRLGIRHRLDGGLGCPYAVPWIQ